MKRKTFIQQTALGALASMTLPRLLAANPDKGSPFGRIGNIGIQLFSIPKWLEEAPQQTLERLAAMGGEIHLNHTPGTGGLVARRADVLPIGPGDRGGAARGAALDRRRRRHRRGW